MNLFNLFRRKEDLYKVQGFEIGDGVYIKHSDFFRGLTITKFVKGGGIEVREYPNIIFRPENLELICSKTKEQELERNTTTASVKVKRCEAGYDLTIIGKLLPGQVLTARVNKEGELLESGVETISDESKV